MSKNNERIESKLLKSHGIIHGFSTKQDGNMSFDRSLNGLAPENLKKFTEKLGIDIESDCLAILNTQNSGNAALIKKASRKNRVIIYQNSPEIVQVRHNPIAPQGIDGAVTQNQNIFLAILPADCPPVYFFDPETGYLGLIHCSAEAVTNNIIFTTLVLLQKNDVKLTDLLFFIGPGICGDCYDQSFDLKQLIFERLLFFGCQPKKIEICPDCTYSQKNKYFSNNRARGSSKEGRQIAIIGKKYI